MKKIGLIVLLFSILFGNISAQDGYVKPILEFRMKMLNSKKEYFKQEEFDSYKNKYNDLVKEINLIIKKASVEIKDAGLGADIPDIMNKTDSMYQLSHYESKAIKLSNELLDDIENKTGQSGLSSDGIIAKIGLFLRRTIAITFSPSTSTSCLRAASFFDQSRWQYFDEVISTKKTKINHSFLGKECANIID